MNISVLSLNINGGNYWDSLKSFLFTHKFDILQLQEIAGKGTKGGNIDADRNYYTELENLLGNDYFGELMVTQHYSSGENAYLGNATFYRKRFKLISKNTLFLHKNEVPLPTDLKRFEETGRGLIHLILQISGKNISFLNTHFAWAKTPAEEPHQTKQGEILIRYLKNVSDPFVLSGDFNLSPDQPLIHKINSLARNLINENNVVNTLNPRIHRAKVLFPPGTAVDYIFVSKNVSVEHFGVFSEFDISDHLGLGATITI